MLFVTREPAPGITGDSLYYLSGADALAKSGQLAYATYNWRAPDSITPMTRVMPGLSLVLASGIRIGVSALQGARVLQAISAFGIVFAAAWLAYSAAGPLTAALVATSFLMLPTFLLVHLYVLTEPLFLVTLLGALVLMTRAQPNPLALGVLAALATLVRYPGVALTLTVCLWMLLQPGRPVDRLRRAVIAGLPTAILLTLWILHAHSSATAEPVRTFGVYGQLAPSFRAGFRTLAVWLAPGSRLPVRIVLATGLAVVVTLAAVRDVRAGSARTDPRAARRRRAIGAALLFIACYLMVIVASRVLADPYIEFHGRMLLPALVAAQVAIAFTLAGWLASRTPVVRWATLGVIGLWLAVSANISRATIVRERRVGLDIARPGVRESAILRWLRADRDARRPIFSNHPYAAYHFLARDARWWPTDTSRDTLSRFASVVRARNGIIVSFAFHDPWTLVAADSVIVRLLGLRAVARLPDGSVWELPGTR